MTINATRWQDIFLHLKAKFPETYSPSTKTGECIKPYLVVKNEGSSRMSDYSSNVDYYSVLCYAPAEQYSKLEVLVQDVKTHMKNLEPMILPAGSETPSFFDELIKGHMISIMYKNHKKL